MRTKLRASALALAFFGSVGMAAAQAPTAGEPGRLNLDQSKGQSVSQGLSGEQSQSAPGYDGNVGSRPPDALQKKTLPSDVQAQVPEATGYLYIKLPDRIILIDPDSQMVAEIVAMPATTGAGGSAGSDSSDQPRPDPGSPMR